MKRNWLMLVYGFKDRVWEMAIAGVLLVALVVRVWNINYNSPFSDEAIYIVIGRLGLFHQDWGTYNAANWIPGLVYLYPSLAALGFVTGGLLGVRMISVVFGVLLVWEIYRLSKLLGKRCGLDGRISGLISSGLIAGSTTAIYVSRLATYDMPSYWLFFSGIYQLIKTEELQEMKAVRKGYWVAGMCLLLAVLVKISVVIYIPGLVIYSWIRAGRLGKDYWFAWRNYYLIWLGLGLGLFALVNREALITYVGLQEQREKIAKEIILSRFWEYAKSLCWFALWGTLGWWKKYWKLWLGWFGGAGLIVGLHLWLQRLATLDKHSLISAVFIAMIAGIGIEMMQVRFRSVERLRLSRWLLGVWLVAYGVISVKGLEVFNNLWSNTSTAVEYLNKRVQPTDRVLSEIGPPVILGLYDQVPPVRVNTFDWFEYEGTVGDQAYQWAVVDGYFNWIQLETSAVVKEPLHGRIHDLVANRLSRNYRLVNEQEGFSTYKRVY